MSRAGLGGKRTTLQAIRDGFERAQQLLRDRGELASTAR